MSHIEEQPGEYEDQSTPEPATDHGSAVEVARRQIGSPLMQIARMICACVSLLRATGRDLQLRWARADERWLRRHRERLLEYLSEQGHVGRIAVERWLQSHWDRLVTRYGKRRVQQVGMVILLVATVVCGPLSVLATVGIFSSHAQTQSGNPNVIDPSAGTQSTIHLPPPPAAPDVQPLTARPAMPHTTPPGMQPGSLTLDPSTATQFVGSDGRLEVDVPAGAVSADDVAAAGGSLVLRLSQLAPASGSNSGGSGLISFGSYLAQLVDSQGHDVTHGFRLPVTLKLHYNAREAGLDVAHTTLVINGAHPKSVQNVGPTTTVSATNDPTNQVLTAQLPADPSLAPTPTPTPAATPTSTPAAMPTATPTATSTPSPSPTASATAAPAPSPTGSPTGFVGALVARIGGAFAAVGSLLRHAVPMTSGNHAQARAQQSQQNANLWGLTWTSTASVAKFGAPDPLNVDLRSGALTQGIQLDVPPGPAQAMPNLTLAYNSELVSEQHNPQATAGWVGEGWSLGLGQITWDERDQTADCSGCAANWQNEWHLTDRW